MGKKRTKIYLQDWLAFHPYSHPKQCDYYYLKLCNEILGTLEEHPVLQLHFNLSDVELRNLACFISGYFEDVISGPGLWKSFITQVMELYGTYLPFFEPDPEEYFPDEINLEDIHFLFWYYISMVRYDEANVGPHLFEVTTLSEDIFEILEREYEEAPENERLKEVYAPPPGKDDFDALIDTIRWIMLDSWLLHFGGIELDEMLGYELAEEGEEPLTDDAREVYESDMADTYIMFSYTPLMARQGKDWLAYLLGKEHRLFDSLRGMGEKKSGFYLYLGQEGDVRLFRHIASETVLRVVDFESMPGNSIAGESMYYGGFVKWRGKWYLLGSLIILESGYASTAAEKEHLDVRARHLFRDRQAVLGGKLEKMHQIFLKYNSGKALVFVESLKKAGEFIREFLLFYNESLDLPESVKEEENELVMELELDRGPFTDTNSDSGESIPGMVFFNPDSGFETAFGYNELIPDPDNLWYIESDSGAGRLLYSQYISGRWMHYLAEHYELPGLSLPGEGGEETMEKNFDFILRFRKREHYYFGLASKF